jgi:hypothetical protein
MPQARAKAHWHYNFKFNNMKLNGAGPVQALRPGLAQPAGMGPSRPDSESGDARAASARPFAGRATGTAAALAGGCTASGSWLGLLQSAKRSVRSSKGPRARHTERHPATLPARLAPTSGSVGRRPGVGRRAQARANLRLEVADYLNLK